MRLKCELLVYRLQARGMGRYLLYCGIKSWVIRSIYIVLSKQLRFLYRASVGRCDSKKPISNKLALVGKNWNPVKIRNHRQRLPAICHLCDL